jgi:hypothetical protein
MGTVHAVLLTIIKFIQLLQWIDESNDDIKWQNMVPRKGGKLLQAS